MSKENQTPSGPAIPGAPAGMSNAEMMKLIAAIQEQQLKNMPKHKRYTMKVMQWLGPKFQNGVHNIDRFLNFVAKPYDPERNDVLQSARAPILFGFYVVLIFFVFGGLWASLAPLDSASPAIGTLVSSSHKRTVQTVESGIVKDVFVAVGDKVKKGDPLIAMDPTRTQTNHDAHLGALRYHLALESRLIAERDNLAKIEFSPDLLKHAETPEVAKILEAQRNHFEAKKKLIADMEGAHAKHVEQIHKDIEGQNAKLVAIKKQYENNKIRLKDGRNLMSKGFFTKEKLLELETRDAECLSGILSTESGIAKLQQELLKTDLELSQKKSEMYQRTTDELSRTQSELAKAKEQYLASQDALTHIIITAPEDGIVNNLTVKTKGAVLQSGSEVAEISPLKDSLVIDAKIDPKNIASVTAGMKAKMRFSAFKSRTTPVFTGTVISVSPDSIVDRAAQQQGGQQSGTYYLAKIELNMEEFLPIAKKYDLTLHPGMQVEIQIVNGTRTLLQYLLDPITDQMFKSFIEK